MNSSTSVCGTIASRSLKNCLHLDMETKHFDYIKAEFEFLNPGILSSSKRVL